MSAGLIGLVAGVVLVLGFLFALALCRAAAVADRMRREDRARDELARIRARRAA